MKNPHAMKILSNQLALRQRRRRDAGMSPQKETALTNEEELTFQKIRSELIDTPEEEALMQSCVDAYGKKAIVELFLEPSLVMGIPYMWFVGIAIVSMIGFLQLHMVLLLAAAPILHAVCFLYYREIRTKRRQAKLITILREGIKI